MLNFIELSLMTNLSQKAVSNTHVHVCVCMCIVYVYIHLCMLVGRYESCLLVQGVCLHALILAFMYKSLHIWVHILCLHVCMHFYIEVFPCMHVCMYICMFAYFMYICLHIHMFLNKCQSLIK